MVYDEAAEIASQWMEAYSKPPWSHYFQGRIWAGTVNEGTAYESYAKDITDKETYLMQKESYEVMISGIKEKIEAQKEAVFVLENQKPFDNKNPYVCAFFVYINLIILNKFVILMMQIWCICFL